MSKFEALHNLMQWAINEGEKAYSPDIKRNIFWEDVFNSIYRQACEAKKNVY